MRTERSATDIAAALGAVAERAEVAAVLEALGTQGSRWRIPTPALVVDLDAFDRNVALMAERARAAGVALRPHAKSHKTSALARRQIAAGAVGVCCAKLGEAEALTGQGIGGILVTSPIVGAIAAERAARLALRVSDFALVVDHVDGALELAAAADRLGASITVVIDIDVGLGRTGASSPEQVVAIAQAVAAAAPALRLSGIQAYGGQWQHMKGAEARAIGVGKGMRTLRACLAALREAGFEPGLITGGGTGTFAADTAEGVFNERQVGSYALMDRDYRDALGDDPDGAFEQSLFVQAQVVSVNAIDWVTVDAGLKALATDGPAPIPADSGRFAGCRYAFFGDEHGMLVRPAGGVVARGERVELVVPHCDPTFDRYDIVHLARGDALVDIVGVDGRGRAQ